MSKLRVKCIKCGEEWQKDSVIRWESSDCSSSLCQPCFVEVISPLIHKKQLLEGNFDCFGKADNFCDQVECKYRQWCLSAEEAVMARKELMPKGQKKGLPPSRLSEHPQWGQTDSCERLGHLPVSC